MASVLSSHGKVSGLNITGNPAALTFLVVFLSLPRQMFSSYFELDYDSFLPHPFQFIMHTDNPTIRRYEI
jgi:hypothetical protein